MRVFFIILTIFCFYTASLTSCRAVHTTATVAADTVSTQSATTAAVTTTADSVAHSDADVVDSHVVELVTQVATLYDTAGRVTAQTTTTIERTTSTTAAHTSATVHTTATTDSTATTEATTTEAHHTATSEATKEPTAATHQPLRLRLRWLFIGLLAAFCLIAWHRYKQLANHDYWQ